MADKYEAARIALAERMSEVQREEPASGYGAMADELRSGDLMRVPTWLALEALGVEMAVSRALAEREAVLERLLRCVPTHCLDRHLRDEIRAALHRAPDAPAA